MKVGKIHHLRRKTYSQTEVIDEWGNTVITIDLWDYEVEAFIRKHKRRSGIAYLYYIRNSHGGEDFVLRSPTVEK